MNIKSLVTVSLFIFWAVVAAVLTAGLVFYQNRQSPAGAVMPGVNAPTPAAQAITLSAAEVAKHNSARDCWMIINNQVYNLTAFISAHPGGAAEIIKYCGRDGTRGFQTKDQANPAPHSATATNLLPDFYLGSLNQTVNQQQVQATATAQPPVPRGENDEREDD